MAPYVPRYESPKQKAARRADLKARLFWVAVAIPLLFLFLAVGYSDQAPAVLRDAIRAFDRAMGYPIISLLNWMFS
jgi:hypothetical protein